LEHKDSTGRSAVIRAGEVQIMSAGSGIAHSEYNHSKTEAVNFLQIWVLPKKENIAPRYEQKEFAEKGRQNQFQTVVSPNRTDGGVWINQDAYFSLADFGSEQSVRYSLKNRGNGVYLFVIEGELETAGETLSKRDAIGIWETEQIERRAKSSAKLLVVEIPMN
jgi:redox-sensitive bicupin YhaK (pirin superfamily)